MWHMGPNDPFSRKASCPQGVKVVGFAAIQDKCRSSDNVVPLQPIVACAYLEGLMVQQLFS